MRTMLYIQLFGYAIICIYTKFGSNVIMKQTMNFRLSKSAATALTLLEKKLHSSKTAIVEEALIFYAKKKLTQQNQLLKFAGMLNEREGEQMLEAIQSNKHNKDIEVKL